VLIAEHRCDYGQATARCLPQPRARFCSLAPSHLDKHFDCQNTATNVTEHPFVIGDRQFHFVRADAMVPLLPVLRVSCVFVFIGRVFGFLPIY